LFNFAIFNQEIMAMKLPIYPYNLGYALSGGGARGYAHLGVLSVLEAHGVKPQMIAGTSAGSLVGVLYADGYSPEEIFEISENLNFKQLVEITKPTSGFFKTSGITNFLRKHLRAKSFEELKIPFVAVVADMHHSITHTFSQGNHLIEAVVASCSVPILFEPQVIDGKYYSDGGIFKNLPVSVIRDKCRYIIASNVSLMSELTEPLTMKSVAEHTFKMMSNANVLEDSELCDILIEVHGLKQTQMFDLDKKQELVEKGKSAATIKLNDTGALKILSNCKKHDKLMGKIRKS
jgi:NTE family protein